MPNKLLHYFMHKHGFRVETVRVALARNERASHPSVNWHLKRYQALALETVPLIGCLRQWLTGPV
jgi:hypothetical protein